MSKTTRKFKAEVTQVLSLVINSLYSNKEIFLRELVSNASDALDKLQFLALTDPSLLAGDTSLKIRITPDEEAGTLTIWDNGIGMDNEDLITLLGTIAHSGSREFMEKLKEGASKDVNIIGQFGVGFYSAYLVADRVEVISRKAGSDQAYKWSSDAKENFTVEEADREERGTTIVLHLLEEQKEYLTSWRLRTLVKKYSDFVSHPIEMQKMTYGEEEAAVEFEQVNQASALWQRSASEVTEEQYQELYKHLTSDWEPAMAHTHFRVEGMQLFTGLLYLPTRPPHDLFNPEMTHGMRLFVKRVFIMDNADALMPRWLRFVRGVVDSDDLPLNVSRELLQDSRIVATMRKQLVKKSLDMLEELAAEKPEEYAKFWKNFGVVLKEGLHFEPNQADRLGKLLRYQTSTQTEPTSLDSYIERMPEGQESIYYAIGASRNLLAGSPHLEMLKKKGFEVLYMVDGIDQWAVDGLKEYGGKTLVDALQGELDLSDDDDAEDKTEALAPLTVRFQDILKDEVSEVRLSKRLDESPACLVQAEGGIATHIERMLREQNQDMPEQKRILELNANHPLITAINQLSQGDKSDKVNDWAELIYDQALLAEGSPIKEPAKFAQRLTGLMQEVATAQLN